MSIDTRRSVHPTRRARAIRGVVEQDGAGRCALARAHVRVAHEGFLSIGFAGRDCGSGESVPRRDAALGRGVAARHGRIQWRRRRSGKPPWRLLRSRVTGRAEALTGSKKRGLRLRIWKLSRPRLRRRSESDGCTGRQEDRSPCDGQAEERPPAARTTSRRPTGRRGASRDREPSSSRRTQCIARRRRPTRANAQRPRAKNPGARSCTARKYAK